MNHYQTLGVPRSATADEIKTAYRKAIREVHPDQFIGRLARAEADGNTREIDAAQKAMQKAEEKAKNLNAAYDVLSDPAKRRWYDLSIREHTTGSTYRPPRSTSTRPPNTSGARNSSSSGTTRRQTQSRPAASPPPTSMDTNRGRLPAAIWMGLVTGFALLYLVISVLTSGSSSTRISNQEATIQLMTQRQLYGTLAFNPSQDNVEMGDTFYKAGLFDKAVEQYTTVINTGTKDPRVYYKRGLAYVGLMFDPQDEAGRQALADFKMSLSLNAQYAEAHFEIGKLYAARWQYTKNESDRVDALYHLNQYMELVGIDGRSDTQAFFELLR